MHDEAIRKADVLIEALAYFRKFYGRFTVIKLGGSVMEDPESLRALLVDVVFMQTVGLRPVVVHGGGKAISAAMARAGLEPRWVQGRRYTDEATLEIAARVLAEEVNTDIVRHIGKYGGRAAGLHHKSTQCLFGRRLTLPGPNGEAIDLGHVGRGHGSRRDADRELLPRGSRAGFAIDRRGGRGGQDRSAERECRHGRRRRRAGTEG